MTMTTMKCTNGHVQLHEAPCSCGAPKAENDPWVKVGTTTIDGTVMQVATMLEASAWGSPVNDDEAEAHIDNFVRCGAPWLIGGRYLLPKGSHINGNLGTALIRCDIVRRLSECCEYCDRDHLTNTQRERAGECSSCSASIAAKMSSPASAKPTCPECGPHGNRGEVLLASSWAKCTTCAGGKPGDLWGEVKAQASPGVKSYTLAIGDLVFDEEAEVKRGPATAQGATSSALIAKDASSEVAQAEVRAFIDALNKPPSFPTPATAENLMRFEIASGIRAPDGRSFMDARREALAAQHGQGFKVPTISEMRGAELDNLLHYLEGDRVVDRWGRTGVVVPPDKSWPKSVRVRMDAGWTGIFSLREIAGKADP